MLCGRLDEKGVWGRIDTDLCMAESLCCPPEAITTLLIGYITKKLSLIKKIKRIRKWRREREFVYKNVFEEKYSL